MEGSPLEELMIRSSSQEMPLPFRTLRSNTVLARASYRPLSWARYVHTFSLISMRFILILSSRHRLCRISLFIVTTRICLRFFHQFPVCALYALPISFFFISSWMVNRWGYQMQNLLYSQKLIFKGFKKSLSQCLTGLSVCSSVVQKQTWDSIKC
jgi:hypothetical protein